ncbi:hypothetical protein SAMN04487926_15322 [Paraburkholderia steynii]|uniref:Uncharacterized protein n=2 Tax=Paraburkholderia steynii TaxID=1245441 RepID=A0A7Z7FQY8_9BURK|nr:hypothetical protein SAMN04487926_15322 [Paraburkholderia steynii]
MAVWRELDFPKSTSTDSKVTKLGSGYSHFPSPGALFETVAAWVAEEMNKRVSASLASVAVPHTAAPGKRYSLFLVALCVRVNDRKCRDLLYDQQLPIQTCVTGNSQV